MSDENKLMASLIDNTIESLREIEAWNKRSQTSRAEAEDLPEFLERLPEETKVFNDVITTLQGIREHDPVLNE